nr:MAG TPA: coiled-coil domain-containing protein [Caudoviricetes sp.]
MFRKNLAVSSCYFIVCALTAIYRKLIAFIIILHSR